MYPKTNVPPRGVYTSINTFYYDFSLGEMYCFVRFDYYRGHLGRTSARDVLFEYKLHVHCTPTAYLLNKL